MADQKRLIEVAFPLKQASLDSVHEKNVRHGHISTLHVWPARRPLAACRAALIATLLPDPGNETDRKELLEKIGGKVIKNPKMKKLPSGKIEKKLVEETVDGILHWGRESNADMDWFRKKIREVYGGRAPKVLDPFSGGGAIPFEAMRLGCEVTASDINPVAWFVLKCTLEYPQKLVGQKRYLPSFALEDSEFLNEFLKATSGVGGNGKRKTIKSQGTFLEGNSHNAISISEADLAWHVRAWGRWVLDKAKADLEPFYPVIEGKPTVAYLWARTVTCKNCRAIVPLLKTKWLCKKNNNRVLLSMKPNAEKTGVTFSVETDVLKVGSNPAQRREHDKRIGFGTMSRSGATCPCCCMIMTMQDIRLEGQAGRLGSIMTAVVIDGDKGKEYRKPMKEDLESAYPAGKLDEVFSQFPFGLPEEPIIEDAKQSTWCVAYGFDKWSKLFTQRQLMALGTFVKYTRASRELMVSNHYSQDWIEAISAYLACAIDRLVDFCNVNTQWKIDGPTINHALVRFAIPLMWDFAEGNPIGSLAGSYEMCLERVIIGLETILSSGREKSSPPTVTLQSALEKHSEVDIVLTDPPYYDAISYSDIMDLFYVWLRRTVYDLSDQYSSVMSNPIGPKWNSAEGDGELIDDASRHGADSIKSKKIYENGMIKALSQCAEALNESGKLIIVFANKQPDAWETLVSSVIQAGFVAKASWPIQTEQPNRSRGQSSAALSSSIWLVCSKRSLNAHPGWDNQVLDEMRANIGARLRDFWDVGIRGPDFVWAATGPALESYSKYPVVKKADDPGQVMSISEFLTHVRRIVVDFVVGRVLSKNGESDSASSLDDITTYYLLHRYDFGMDDAPIGACILYAISCGLSDRALVDQYDILARTGKQAEDEEQTEEADEDESEMKSGNRVKLKPWNQRKQSSMGYEVASGRPVPYIDQVHRLMHLWKAGNVVDVDDYLNAKGLRRNHVFHQLLQSIIELAAEGSEERSLLESISNHIGSRGVTADSGQQKLAIS